jgi:hypothetical protein
LVDFTSILRGEPRDGKRKNATGRKESLYVFLSEGLQRESKRREEEGCFVSVSDLVSKLIFESWKKRKERSEREMMSENGHSCSEKKREVDQSNTEELIKHCLDSEKNQSLWCCQILPKPRTFFHLLLYASPYL